MSFAIESGGSLPKRSHGRKPTFFPLLEMRAPIMTADGPDLAYFDIPFADAETPEATAKLVESWRRKVRTFEKSVEGQLQEGTKFSTVKVDGGLRVLRSA